MNTTLGSIGIPNTWHKTFVGFDRIFDELMNLPSDSNYPPSNILKVNENTYLIELALAGFKEKDIDITLEDHTLTISGEKDDSEIEYVHRGIANRKFKKVFSLADHIEVKGADLSDGILTIRLQEIIPEALKPKHIKIGTSPPKEFLQETKK